VSRTRELDYDARVTLPAWLAAVVLFLQLPIPLYWFVVHPQIRFWRRHQKTAYAAGLLCSWLPVTIAIAVFRRSLFRSSWPSPAALAAGVTLIILEVWIFWRVDRDLGTARLVGKTELSGAGEMERGGIYSWVRHPRYTASLLAILGASIVAGTWTMWLTAATWLLLMAVVIALEEREMRTRFGAAYQDYCRTVPRFLPWPRKSASR
jgi:protein-S-isoprenylcysteine O-methyltransferase Ste14